MPVTAESFCPCGGRSAQGKTLAFAECCGRYLGHFDTTPAPDAPALMRSRYTAFVRGDQTYLLATWHASQRPPEAAHDAATKWLGLEVRDHRATDADHAEVEFVARYRPSGSGPAIRLHERSRFVRQEGRWFYLDGEII
jgi:SEC-C motif-containing protein